MPPAETHPRNAARVAGIALVIALAGGCGGSGASGQSEPPGTDTPAVTLRAVGEPALVAQTSGTTALLQGVSVVDESVVWISGHRGTWSRTIDGGANWTTGTVAGADSLQFRDVHALSADVAWLLSAGPGELSRVYRTNNAGLTWTLQWTNEEPEGFYDCMDFWDDRTGVVYGDEIGGHLRMIRTVDGGEHWERVTGTALPAAQPGEGGFAASGTCFITGDDGRGWVSTGNAARGRVLRTDDRGASWTVFDTPIAGGEGAGLFGVSFRNADDGVVFAGALGEPAEDGVVQPRIAVSDDGGASWTAAGQPTFDGAVFGGEFVPGTEPAAMVAVAPTGASYSVDGGHSWAALDTAAYWGLGFASPDAGWLVGPGGRITKVVF